MAEVQVSVRKADPSTIRMTLHQGNLILEDGTEIGSVSGLGSWICINLKGMGRWENLIQRELAETVAQAAQFEPGKMELPALGKTIEFLREGKR